MVKIEVSTVSPAAEYIPGLLNEPVITEVADERVLPPGLEMLWIGIFLGQEIFNNPELNAQLPTREDGTPIITPDTVKIGLFRG